MYIQVVARLKSTFFEPLRQSFQLPLIALFSDFRVLCPLPDVIHSMYLYPSIVGNEIQHTQVCILKLQLYFSWVGWFCIERVLVWLFKWGEIIYEFKVYWRCELMWINFLTEDCISLGICMQCYVIFVWNVNLILLYLGPNHVNVNCIKKKI